MPGLHERRGDCTCCKPHGLTATHAHLVNRDLLAFIQQGKRKVALSELVDVTT